MKQQTHVTLPSVSNKRGFVSLSPLLLMVILFFALSLWLGDFYQVSLVVLFLAASVYSICLLRGEKLQDRIALFSKNAGDSSLLLMIWIFVLAGSFASAAKEMGAVDATVGLTLSLIPGNMLLAGMFMASCLVSLSVGTSVGTIVALVPVATGLAQHTGISLPLMVASIVGGALFGDNLSFISDTTVVATRTQGCRMKDKFRANFLIALPAAVMAIVIYVWLGSDVSHRPVDLDYEWQKVIPYLFVLLAAVWGMNVILVLTLGLALTGIVGIGCGAITLHKWLQSIASGIGGMSELIIISMMAGGLLGIVRHLGGIQWVLQSLTRHVRTSRGAEYAMAMLVSVTNLCTANNTIAILSVGDLVRNIAQQLGVSPKKAASILDTFSCCIQGVIPYGMQLLMAGGLASVPPASIVPYLYYPFLLFFVAIVAIWFRLPKV